MASLAVQDPELQQLITNERKRQIESIELIASENFVRKDVLDCLHSCLTNKYSEGYPGKRYYGGNEYIDQIEILCQKRALEAFHLDSNEWGVNVQPYSGSPANFAIYTGLLKPGDRIMGLDLFSGGHLTHGFQTPKTKVSSSAIYFESQSYKVDEETGLVDYEKLRAQAKEWKPKMLICGGSAYARDWDYEKLRSVADDCGAILFCDMAHYAGLVAAKLLRNPFDYCDVVSTTTHKTLQGPRSGLIFIRKSPKALGGWPNGIVDGEAAVNAAVFPGCQGGPHNHQIAAVATQLKEVASPRYHKYARQVQLNAARMAKVLLDAGQVIVSGGTDTHLVLWDLRTTHVTGSQYQLLCDELNITLNKNSVPGDVSAMNPYGVRIGTPAMTSRKCGEKECETITGYLLDALKLAFEIQESATKKANLEEGKKLPIAKFTEELHSQEYADRIKSFKQKVIDFAKVLHMPGVHEDTE